MIIDSYFYKNTAWNGPAFALGLDLKHFVLLCANNIFEKNLGDVGGVFYITFYSLTSKVKLVNNFFFANEASIGGCIFAQYAGYLEIEKNIFIENLSFSSIFNIAPVFTVYGYDLISSYFTSLMDLLINNLSTLGGDGVSGCNSSLVQTSFLGKFF